MTNNINEIKVILIETSLPENIGACARAMKTMGLSNLALVNPKNFPNEAASAMASHARDILDNAQICGSIEEAVADSQVLFATSARKRANGAKILSSADLSECINNKCSGNKIAILFGPERTGLTNEDLALCDYHIVIPTSEEYSSLNLAAAVQIIGYEICKNSNKFLLSEDSKVYPEFTDKNQFFEHFEQILKNKNFINQNNQESIMLKLHSIFNRAQMTKAELNMMRGVLSSIEKFG